MSKNGWIPLNAHIVASAAVVGNREKQGPIGECFDMFDPTDKFGQKTWEMAESEMQRRALTLAIKKGKRHESDLGAIFAGDLLNQCVGAAYGLMDFPAPYFGLYGACSTAAEGLILSGICATYRIFDLCAAVASSHFCTAERQYRSPIEYGGQRTPTAQWTVTGAGAYLVAHGGGEVELSSAMPGIVVEKGITDTSNMGAAMAPAALDTLVRFFRATSRDPRSFDLIVTGDLGYEGISILGDMLYAEGYDVGERLNDCGMMIYQRQTQDTHAGGSGCGCSASVVSGYLLPKIRRGELREVLVLGTGAMMSPDSIKQGQAIPAVAHLVHLRHGDGQTEERM